MHHHCGTDQTDCRNFGLSHRDFISLYSMHRTKNRLGGITFMHHDKGQLRGINL